MRKFNVTVNGTTYSVDVEEVGANTPMQSAPALVSAPAPAAAPAPAPVKTAAPVAAGSKKVESPMPGTIVSVKVKAGDTVKADTLVAVLEAMKMENEIMAPCDGTVSSVIAKGTSAQTGTVLCVIK